MAHWIILNLILYEQYFNSLWCYIFSFCRISMISEFSPLGIGFKTKNRKSRKIFIFWICKAQWIWVCFLITILTFWVLKLIQKKIGPSSIKPKCQKIFKPKYLLYDKQCGWIILSLMSFEQHFNCFWIYVLILQYYGAFVEFPWFPSFRFRVLASKRKAGNHGKSLFLGLQSSNAYESIFDLYFSFLRVKTKINKNVLNFINLDGLEAFERQTPGNWLEKRINHFEFD